MESCPFCSDRLLLQAGSKGTYRFCRSCWQKIPSTILSNHGRAIEFHFESRETILHELQADTKVS